MANYEKPVVTTGSDMAEGVFMASGGSASWTKVSSGYKHSSYYEVKWIISFPPEYVDKHIKVEVHFAGNVFEAWGNHEHAEERTLANNVLTYQEHSARGQESSYTVAAQSYDSEEACRITNVVITPM